MKNKTIKILFFAIGIGLFTTSLGLLTTHTTPTKASPPPAPMAVRVTNPPLEPEVASETVTLQTTSQLSASCTAGSGSFTFDRLVVKSGVTVVPFVLAAGKVLVATSFDWSATGEPAVANQARTAWLFRATAGGTNGPSAQSTAIAGSNGKAGGSETFPTGIVLQNPGNFCLRMDSPVAGEILQGVLQGFLAPDK